MTELHYLHPNEVSGQLQVSPSTLRRWSSEFADYLSATAGPTLTLTGQGTHRRYTDADVDTLKSVKDLLGEGMTYIQVCKRLDSVRLRQGTAVVPGAAEAEGGPLAIFAAPVSDRGAVSPAVAVLADTLHTVAEGQQLLLGSQQANRDLISVIVQDNFTLKEENAKLRDRMLELERDLAELRRQDDAQRQTIETRLEQVEAQLRWRRRVAKPPERTGCLDSLFGLLD